MPVVKRFQVIDKDGTLHEAIVRENIHKPLKGAIVTLRTITIGAGGEVLNADPAGSQDTWKGNQSGRRYTSA
jgi:hypothetical protein